jgi:hypothetical protein
MQLQRRYLGIERSEQTNEAAAERLREAIAAVE